MLQKMESGHNVHVKGFAIGPFLEHIVDLIIFPQSGKIAVFFY